jgi:RES domain-containing protein
MIVWRLQSGRHPLINSEGARLTGGRWNQQGTAVIYASESAALAAMEILVHHGGIPEDYIGVMIAIPDDLEILTAEVPAGWPDVVPEQVTARQGTRWVNECKQAVLRVPSATMSISGYNYILNPAHPDFIRISFSFAPFSLDPRLRTRSGEQI